MAFVQIVEFTTTRPDTVEELVSEWRVRTSGRRTAQRGTFTQDRERPNTYVQIVEFPSYEDAMANSDLPETAALADQLRELCDGPILFRNLCVPTGRARWPSGWRAASCHLDNNKKEPGSAQNGQLAPVQFSPASVADYNNALATLQNEANRLAAVQQAAAAAARLRLEQAIAATSDTLTNACVAADGSVVPEGGGSAFPSSCTVDGVSDQVYGGGTPQASYAEPPATIETDAQGCRDNGGSWGYEPGDGYYTGQSDWDCTVDGFQDQVISLSSGSYDVPISSVRAVAALMNAQGAMAPRRRLLCRT
jgi:hypothetical protein